MAISSLTLKRLLLSLLVLGVLLCLLLFGLWQSRQEVALNLANRVLQGYGAQITELEIAALDPSHLSLSRLSLQLEGMHLTLGKLDLRLKTPLLHHWHWRHGLEPLSLGQYGLAMENLDSIHIENLDIGLDASLLRHDATAEERRWALRSLMAGALPQLDIAQTRLSLLARDQSSRDLLSRDPPMPPLIINKLQLDRTRQLKTRIGFDDRPLLQLDARLASDQWQLESQLELEPLQQLLTQLASWLRLTWPGTDDPLPERAAALIDLSDALNSKAMEVGGALHSSATLSLAGTRLSSQHSWQAPRLILGQWQRLDAAPKQPLSFSLSGELNELSLTIAPNSWRLSPSRSQADALIALLNPAHTAAPSSTSAPPGEPGAKDIELLLDLVYAGAASPDGQVTTENDTLRHPSLTLSLNQPLSLPLSPQLGILLAEQGSRASLNLPLPAMTLEADSATVTARLSLGEGQVQLLDGAGHTATTTATTPKAHTDTAMKLSATTRFALETKQLQPLALQALWQGSEPQDTKGGTLISGTGLMSGTELQLAGSVSVVAGLSRTAQSQSLVPSLGELILTLDSQSQLTVGELSVHRPSEVLGNVQPQHYAKIAASLPAPGRDALMRATKLMTQAPLSLSLKRTSHVDWQLTLPPMTLSTGSGEANLRTLDFRRVKRQPNIDGDAAPADAAPPFKTIATHKSLTWGGVSITKESPTKLKLHSDSLIPGLNSLLRQVFDSQQSDRLIWQLNRINAEQETRRISSKGNERLRREPLGSLNELRLTQTLSWDKGSLQGDEKWQLDDLRLTSQHRLTLPRSRLPPGPGTLPQTGDDEPTAKARAHRKAPILLAAHWQMHASVDALSRLAKKFVALPPSLSVNGDARLEANIEASFADAFKEVDFHFSPELKDLYGRFSTYSLDGGHALVQCRLNWQQADAASTGTDTLSAQGPVMSSALDCDSFSLTLTSLDPGVPLSNVELTGRLSLTQSDNPQLATSRIAGLDDADIRLEARGELLGGEFLLPDFTLRLRDKSHGFLVLQGMSLEELLKVQPQVGVYADGIFDGVLPVDLVDDKVSVTGGRLAARAPGGLIAVSGNPAVEQMRLAQPYLDFAFLALEHLNYSELASSFDMAPNGDARLEVEVKGRSQGIERPIELNYSHEENLLQLLKSLRIGDRLQDRIEESVK